MMNEEAISILKRMSDCSDKCDYTCRLYDSREHWCIKEVALDMAIKALEQQPCEDCISRQAVLDKKVLVELEDGQTFYDIDPKDVETLPSVTPQPKVGRWEKAFDEHSYWYKCSCCGEKIPKNFYGNDYFSLYCPECGAKMEVEE